MSAVPRGTSCSPTIAKSARSSLVAALYEMPRSVARRARLPYALTSKARNLRLAPHEQQFSANR